MASASPAGTGKSLLDTNVLVYCYDTTDATKQRVAIALLEQLAREQRFVLSAQVINEFYVATTRPTRPSRLTHDEAVQAIRNLLLVSTQIVPHEPALTFIGLDAVQMHGLSFWDALIWAAAKSAGASTVYTEDFQHGRQIEGVTFINPFI